MLAGKLGEPCAENEDSALRAKVRAGIEALEALQREFDDIKQILDGDGVTSSAKEAALAADALIQTLLEERKALKRPAEQPAPKCERSNLPAVWDLVCEEIRPNLVEFEAMLPEQIDMWEIYGRALTLAMFVGKQAGSTNVLVDMRERDAVGRTRYGVPLQPHNGRKPLVDAYQELLDAVVYLRQHIYETEHPETQNAEPNGTV